MFTKESAFIDRSPFTLRFATSVNIDHNIPDKSPLRNTNPRLIGDYQSKEQLCESTGDTISTIIASDDNTALDVSNVEVNFICHKYFCPLGNTTLVDGRALLRTKLPNSCYGATLEFSKDGYITTQVPVQNGVTSEFTTYQADMTPLIDVNYK